MRRAYLIHAIWIAAFAINCCNFLISLLSIAIFQDLGATLWALLMLAMVGLTFYGTVLTAPSDPE